MRRARAREQSKVGRTGRWRRVAARASGAVVLASCVVGWSACKHVLRVQDDDAGAQGAGDAARPPAPTASAVDVDGATSPRGDAATAMLDRSPGLGLRLSGDVPTGVTFPDGVGREIAQLEPAFRACYARGLARDAKQEGAPVVTVVVNQAGQVASSRMTDDGLRDDVVACLMAKVKGASFDPVIGDGRTLSFQVTFRPPR